MLSQSAVYALQAGLYLAGRENGDRATAKEVGEELNIPTPYLAKVLQRLRDEGVVEGVRGPRGGYRLTRDPACITVVDVVAPFYDMGPPQTCLLGGECHMDQPCVAHRRRSEWNEAIQAVLRETTLQDLLGGDRPGGALRRRDMERSSQTIEEAS